MPDTSSLDTSTRQVESRINDENLNYDDPSANFSVHDNARFPYALALPLMTLS